MVNIKRDKYSNVLVYNLDKEPISTTCKGRAEFLIKKGLAVVPKFKPKEPFSKSIQLTYNLEKKVVPSDLIYRENKCVICGCEERLTIHHIIPKVIIKQFNSKYRFDSKNLVLLCDKHHKKVEGVELVKSFHRNLNNSYMKDDHYRALGEICSLRSQLLYETKLKWHEQERTKVVQQRRDLAKKLQKEYVLNFVKTFNEDFDEIFKYFESAIIDNFSCKKYYELSNSVICC